MAEGSGTVIWKKIKKEIAIWRIGALPGFAVLTIVIIARLSGLVQPLELMALDNFLRLRPAEPMDDRITIIGINEDDITNAKTYPIPDKEIAALLRKIQNYQPRVIGLDIYRDFPVDPKYAKLTNYMKQNERFIAICAVGGDKVLQYGQTFAEVRGNRRFDNGTIRLGHQTTPAV